MEEYNIKAIPTMYNGVQFRSRLEATWAAFFDLCEWNWDYEPIDLNGWIPDFIIHGEMDIYVEVKPFTELEQFDDAIKKINKTGIDEDILLLGLCPFGDKWLSYLGWCNENHEDCINEFEPAFFSDHGENWNNIFKFRYDYYDSLRSFTQRLNLMYDGDHYNDECDPRLLWKQAKNKVQWRKPL